MSNIPKVIHYCWFGENPIPFAVKKCIESWKKYCPHYKIVEWNENNFDYTCNPYVYEAYQAKKWAFVSDYVRLYVLKEQGGIYMDTDVELLKNLDTLLEHNAFSGFENKESIQTAVMGADNNNSWINMLLKSYENRHFIKADGSFDLTTNVTTITAISKETYNIELNNSMQITSDGTVFYPNEFFSPKNFETGVTTITQNTYCIHHFDASWLTRGEKLKHFCTSRLKMLIGEERVNKLKAYLKK